MRILFRAALPLVLLLSAAASAIEIEAGGRTIEIPVPAGYAELTPEMSPWYEATYAYVAPTNERYLVLVPSEVAERYLLGKDADYHRYMMVEAEKQSVRFDITQDQFDELRSTMRGQIEELGASLRETLPDMFDDAGDSISAVVDADLELSLGEIIPFEPHLDTESAFAFSQLVSMGVAVDGEDQDPEVSTVTATLLNVRDKMIFVNVYGSEEDLEWTRVFASNWADQIIAANSPPTDPAPSPAASNEDAPQPATDTASDRERSGGFMLGPASKAVLVALALLVMFFVLRRLRRQREN